MNLTNGQFEQPTSFPMITRTMMTTNSKNIKINLIFSSSKPKAGRNDLPQKASAKTASPSPAQTGR